MMFLEGLGSIPNFPRIPEHNSIPVTVQVEFEHDGRTHCIPNPRTPVRSGLLLPGYEAGDRGHR